MDGTKVIWQAIYSVAGIVEKKTKRGKFDDFDVT